MGRSGWANKLEGPGGSTLTDQDIPCTTRDPATSPSKALGFKPHQDSVQKPGLPQRLAPIRRGGKQADYQRRSVLLHPQEPCPLPPTDFPASSDTRREGAGGRKPWLAVMLWGGSVWLSLAITLARAKGGGNRESSSVQIFPLSTSTLQSGSIFVQPSKERNGPAACKAQGGVNPLDAGIFHHCQH